MFYEVDVPPIPPGARRAAALVVLNPSESRRLIAKATVALPEVRHAFRQGTIIIARGITNAFVTEERPSNQKAASPSAWCAAA